MERPRAHSFSLAFMAVGVLALGFLAGSLVSDYILARREQPQDMQGSAAGVMAKRMAAIKKAVKNGSSEYEFEVSAARPILK